MAERIVSRPEYTYVPHKPMRIDPNPNYKPPNLHTKHKYPHSVQNRIEAEWCPICHSQDIGEIEKNDTIMWRCKTCNYEW